MRESVLPESQTATRLASATAATVRGVSGHSFPTTRYQGSKRRLAQAIVDQLRRLDFHTVLDAFGGTGAVAHAFKCAGKAVTCNDALVFNYQIALALIENSRVRLEGDFSERIGVRHRSRRYSDFIERTFAGIYFTDEENRWLDVAVGNVRALSCPYQRALGYFVLMQAGLAKRPYNLFHRRNLYMRSASVRRGFGNKTSWDRSFSEHARRYVEQANRAVLDTGVACRATCGDALAADLDFDLVYLDPPYVNRAGVGVDYRDFYHFLEGMVRYDEWPQLVDFGAKHRRLLRQPDPWTSASTCPDLFRRMFERFHRSILVLSYRDDGIPTPAELLEMLRRVRPHVELCDQRRYQYALSTRRDTCQLLFIAR
ncbi:MAG TPA: DNA adenine methylase [Phycisphaerae bacterium]|nr:DNA adenine methylase [Phycisphaerae bacterium]HNU44609.1 DNA adenine methylase [Phycisphaerae bacterium]